MANKRQVYMRASKRRIVKGYIVDVVSPARFGFPDPDNDIVIMSFAYDTNDYDEALRRGVIDARSRDVEMPFHLRIHARPCPDCKDD